MILNLIFLTEINFITIFNIYTIKSEPVKFKNISQINLNFGVESFNFSIFLLYICFGIIFLFTFIFFSLGAIVILIGLFYIFFCIIGFYWFFIFWFYLFFFTIHLYYFCTVSVA